MAGFIFYRYVAPFLTRLPFVGARDKNLARVTKTPPFFGNITIMQESEE